MSDNSCVIEVSHVSHKYKTAGEYSLRDVSLQINRSDIFGLLGPNGAGKTSLISILCHIFNATEGQVSYLKNKIELSALDRKRAIGFVPQDFAFYAELTPRQNLDYFGAMYDMDINSLRNRREHLLQVLGLEKVADKKVETFSGGMKRRLNLAIGIIHEPEFLFLDEPTVGVDVQSKNAIIKYLQELNHSGTTIIYTSHHLSEAEELCNRIAMMDNGSIIAEGGMGTLLAQHDAKDLQALFIKLTGEAYRD